MLYKYGINPHPTTAKNPQANAICERLHLTIANAIQALSHVNLPRDLNEVTVMVDTAISTATYAARAAVHNNINILPGPLVFHRDMFLDIPIMVDLQLLQHNRQVLIDKQLMLANTKRISFDYQPGQKVLKLAISPNKLDPFYGRPYVIHTVHTNGMVTLQITPVIQECINIRRIRPFYPS